VTKVGCEVRVARLLFGAGFPFGVAFTVPVLGVVWATIPRQTGRQLLRTDVVVTLAASIFFAGDVGVSTYVLAVPEEGVALLIDAITAPNADGDGDR